MPNPIGNPATDPYTDSLNIIVGGTATSIVIGRASVVEVPSPTEYRLPMSVMVTDSSGAAVPGALVSLTTFPSYYRHGVWASSSNPASNCFVWPFYSLAPGIPGELPGGWIPNEDVNRDFQFDPLTEDRAYNYGPYADPYGNPSDPVNGTLAATYTHIADGVLQAPNAAAGSVPFSVTTDAFGVANFKLTYLQNYGNWIMDEVTASTMVNNGSESKATIQFVLPVAKSDASGCVLPGSSFNFQ
jgi:hypothetical protein